MNQQAQTQDNPFPQQTGKPLHPDPASVSRANDPSQLQSGAVQHQALTKPDPFKNSGKDIGLVNAPIQSLNPTSGTQKADGSNDWANTFNHKVIENANRYLNRDAPLIDFKYPFEDLDIDQGLFIPVEKNSTTDNLIATIHKQVYELIKQTSECEKDENGDDVWESIVIQTKKRTDDGIIQLDSAGKPIVGANQTNRPKLIHSFNFMVRPVVKEDDIGDGQKAESDGVLVIRVV